MDSIITIDITTLYMWQAVAALNLITIPAALYYFYRCRVLESGVEKALYTIKHYHNRYYRTAALADTLRTYAKGLVKRLNNAQGHRGDSDHANIA